MEILIVYQYFGTQKSAWSTRCYEFSKRWVAEGHSVTVVTSAYDKSDVKHSGIIDGIKVICSKWQQSNQDHFIYRVLKFFAFMCFSTWYALTLKYDLILCSSGPISVGVPGILARKIRKKKLVFEVRDLWPRGAIELGYIKSKFIQNLLYKFEKSCYLNSDKVVALSPDMHSDIAKRYPSVKVECIPNASDNYLNNWSNKTLDFQGKKPYFLYAGSLGVMDDCLQMLEGIKAYNLKYSTGVQFYFIGKGVLLEPMQQFVSKHQLTNVHILGSLPKNELAPYLLNAYACMVCFKSIPVLQTSSPNKLFDALAVSKPVLQNTTGWINDLMMQKPFGYTWKANDANDFAIGVHHLLEESNYKVYQLRANVLAKGHFDRDVLSDKYLQILKG